MKTKMSSKKKLSSLDSLDSLENQCLECGTVMRESAGRLSFPVNGEEIVVPRMTFLRCPQCGEIILRLEESKKLREQAIETYRKKYNLLLSEEIRALRERYHLTQNQLASILRLGVNTLSRWESGRNVQSSAMDVLLRLIRDVPGTLEYLRQWVA